MTANDMSHWLYRSACVSVPLIRKEEAGYRADAAMLDTLCSVLGSVLSWIISPLPLTILTVTIGYALRLLTRDFDFWRSRGVPGPRAVLPWGNEFGVPEIGRASYYGFECWIYEQLGGKRYCGYLELHRPVLYVGDLDLISAITVKDFDHFVDKRNRTFSPVFARMLPFLHGKEWREKRAEITPTFSTGKVKAMLPLFLQTANNLSLYLGEEMKTAGVIDMKDAFGRFALDNIASCAFGIDCNSFKERNTELTKQASAFFRKPGMYGSFRALCVMLLPSQLSDLLPDPCAGVNRFFSRITEQTIRQREEAAVPRRDFLQLLLETKDKSGNRCFSNEDIVTQCQLFYLAGHDTTANLLTFAAYSLATVPSCQEEAHREIDAVLSRHGGRLTYEAVSELHYLDRVLSETLRLYPSLFHMERICTKAYTLPGTQVNIPAGTIVQIPVLLRHRDPCVYPDPLKFDPDRFLPEEKEKRHPNAYMPFGAGPRGCLARRFALIEAKVALAVMLREWRLVPGPDTPPPPMPLNTGTSIVFPRPGCSLLKVVPRNTK